MAFEPIQLHTHGDDRGLLISLEQQRNVPFEIRRVYYLFGTRSGVHRGQHAHRKLNQLAVALHGSVTILLDEGKGDGPTEVTLNDPSQGLLLGRMVWRDLHHFSPDCVLMVLADQLYDPGDYILDYDEFLGEVRGEQEQARGEQEQLSAHASIVAGRIALLGAQS
ncbi:MULTISPECIES: sugar 3,4-ketoisomerase [Xanthomonas]|uniref:sugar 3,4-ketoisomerase n=1 Tax=Xanthomonas TaxID=338 RepID=UPI000E1EC569|nr:MULTISPECIES: FdtA/QdtA family cupin domain-containing protein [Xanthomonas]